MGSKGEFLCTLTVCILSSGMLAAQRAPQNSALYLRSVLRIRSGCERPCSFHGEFRRRGFAEGVQSWGVVFSRFTAVMSSARNLVPRGLHKPKYTSEPNAFTSRFRSLPAGTT